MSIDVHTLNNDVIHIQFRRGWHWDDLRAAIMQADAHIVDKPHAVHLIIDLREAGGIPRDFMQIAGELFAQGEARPNEGLKVVLGAGALMRAAYSGLRRVYALHDRPILFANDLADAQRMIAAAVAGKPE